MGIPKFNDIISLSNLEISEEIIKTEKTLFDLRFKKATRQPFKSHEIKNAKRKLAQLKTILTARLDTVEKKKSNTIVKLINKES
uniref:Large ribosomal subunit protein uL29c n=1 Tax=Roundia cardiophora TaxID=1403802 RepID=A0A089VNG7_9STRA|nr:50S ribosomal protein L29 [Roundia cardiophora]AIR75910.1 50S ribosomal protein L29 [Roundia cardiophora]